MKKFNPVPAARAAPLDVFAKFAESFGRLKGHQGAFATADPSDI